MVISTLEGYVLFEDFQNDGKDTLVIEDGNAVFHGISAIPDTFQMIGNPLLKKLPKSCDTIFSTDLYKKISTKRQERLRRGHGEIRISKDKKPKNQTTGKNSSPMIKTNLPL